MRPSITISALDADRLDNLLHTTAAASQSCRTGLLDELARADICVPEDMPPNVATMNSTVRFYIDSADEQYCLTLAYPRDMEKIPNSISVLSPIGTALLGLAVGDTIAWPRPDGQLMQVRLLEVLYQPERAGEFFR